MPDGSKKDRRGRSQKVGCVAPATGAVSAAGQVEIGPVGECENSRTFFSLPPTFVLDLFGEPISPRLGTCGRRRHTPRAETMARVAELRAEGRTIAEIAVLVGLSETTLRTHYAPQLGSASLACLRFASPAEASRFGPPVRGRPRHCPTDRVREQVRDLVRSGASVAAIAGAVGIAPQTLRRHYADELSARPGRTVRDAH